jgi:hypothetical protein
MLIERRASQFPSPKRVAKSFSEFSSGAITLARRPHSALQLRRGEVAEEDYTSMEDEEDLYDEFGNYIGPAVPDEDDDSQEEDGDDDLEAAYTSRLTATSQHCQQLMNPNIQSFVILSWLPWDFSVTCSP